MLSWCMAKLAPFPTGFLCLWFSFSLILPYISFVWNMISTLSSAAPLSSWTKQKLVPCFTLGTFLLCWIMGSSKGVTCYENKQDQSTCKCNISGLPRTGACFLHWLFPGCFHWQLQALDLSWQCHVWRQQQWMYFRVCKGVLPGRDPEIPSLGAEWAIRHLFIQGWLCHLPLQAHVCPGNWAVAAFLHHIPSLGHPKWVSLGSTE